MQIHYYTSARKWAAIFCCLLIPGLATAQYCTTSLYTSSGNCSEYGDYIESFSTSGGSTNIVNTNTGCSGVDGYNDYTSMVLTAAPGDIISFSLTISPIIPSTDPDGFKIFADWNGDGDFDDAGEDVYTSSLMFAGAVETGTFTVPPGATVGTNTRLRVRAEYNETSGITPCDLVDWGEVEDYGLQIGTAVACSGTPVAGTAAANHTSICAGQNVTLSVTGSTVGSGLDIQWESSDAGLGNWGAIAGATGPVYNVTGQTVPTDYHAVITCSNGGGSDVSNSVTVNMNGFYSCYCSPLTGTTLHSFSFNYTDNVTIAGTTLNSSNPVEGPGGYLQLDPSISSNTATLMQGVAYTINATMIDAGLTAEVWIDYDQNGVFDASEFIPLSASTSPGFVSTATFTIPATALTGLTGMRVRSNYFPFAASEACVDPFFDGETEDYVITIDPGVPCGGNPVAGTAVGPSGACASTPFNLTLSGYTMGLGIEIQWESSDAGMNNWSPIAGATSPFYTFAGQTSATDFRAVITCTNGGGQDISNVVTTAMNPFYNCYCSTHNDGTTAITSLDITGTSFSNTSGAAPGPDFYIAYPPVGGATTSLEQGTTYTINATFDDPAISSVWIDYNQDGIYDASEWTQIGTTGTSHSASFTVPSTALTGLTGMRVRSRTESAQNGAGDACLSMGSGETEDYVITITANPLAITMKDIAATNQGSRNRIDWTIGGLQKGDYFIVERSADSRSFEKLGTVGGDVNKSVYAYFDEQPNKGISYYRLRLTDAAGHNSYSKTVYAIMKPEQGFKLEAFPNPVSDHLSVTVYGKGQNAALDICDLTGRVLQSFRMEDSAQDIDMKALASGVYLLRYSDADHSQTIKINKK